MLITSYSKITPWLGAVGARIAILLSAVCCLGAEEGASTSANTLSEAERRAGWILLFDGKTTSGWMNSDRTPPRTPVEDGSLRTPPRTPVEDGSLNPHKAGHYMLVHTQQWENFVLSLDFKISQGCNSGIFEVQGEDEILPLL